jgi:hypothetical protein
MIQRERNYPFWLCSEIISHPRPRTWEGSHRQIRPFEHRAIPANLCWMADLMRQKKEPLVKGSKSMVLYVFRCLIKVAITVPNARASSRHI